MYNTQVWGLSGTLTYRWLSSSSSCSTESHGEMLLYSVVVKQKVTVFFGCASCTSCWLCGLESTRCFQRIAQLLTNLWRRRSLCNTDQTLMNLNQNIKYILEKYIKKINNIYQVASM